MSFSNLLNELTNSSSTTKNSAFNGVGDKVRAVSSKVPGGLAGGAVAGGLVAMLLGSKSARKTATKAAKYGGVAVLGGLAYKAYKKWQQDSSQHHPHAVGDAENFTAGHAHRLRDFEREALDHQSGIEPSQRFQLALVKAMIAAARADGSIDADEQSRISDAIERMDLDKAAKGELLELFIKPISIQDFIGDLQTTEQKAEAYLASCLVIDLDHQSEYAHLSNLSAALELPSGLEQQLRAQASQASLAPA